MKSGWGGRMVHKSRRGRVIKEYVVLGRLSLYFYFIFPSLCHKSLNWFPFTLGKELVWVVIFPFAQLYERFRFDFHSLIARNCTVYCSSRLLRCIAAGNVAEKGGRKREKKGCREIHWVREPATQGNFLFSLCLPTDRKSSLTIVNSPWDNTGATSGHLPRITPHHRPLPNTTSASQLRHCHGNLVVV